MRILWVTQNGGNYKSNIVKGTGGWIGSMQKSLCETYPDIELAITFFHEFDDTNIHENGVTYMPVKYNNGKSPIQKLLLRHFRNEIKYLDNRIFELVKRIYEYKPDIIHIWGIEFDYVQILKYIHDIPIVVHIQGLLSAYMYAHTPPAISVNDIKHSDSLFTRIVLKNGLWHYYNINKRRAHNEIFYSRFVKNWIGRTDWDYSMSQILSPGSRYFHCDELLRDDFDDMEWNYHFDKKTLYIQSSISCDWYKGIDVILKTAKILKQQKVNICWNIYGWNRDSKILKVFINRLQICPEDVNVFFRGKVEGKIIKEGLLRCDCYVHPSYIENSSNAIAEAQLLGVPVVAQYVGGNPSMLCGGSGLLVAPNEPYIMASKIMGLRVKTTAEMLSMASKKLAKERQNKNTICNDLFNIYKTIIS